VLYICVALPHAASPQQGQRRCCSSRSADCSARVERGDAAAQQDIDIYRLREPVFLGSASAAQQKAPALTSASPAATVAAATHRGKNRGCDYISIERGRPHP